MTNKDKILNYLRYIAPDRATNADLRQQTGIQSHQQVYMLTQELKRERQIRGVQEGKEWYFWCDANPTVLPEWRAAREQRDPPEAGDATTPAQFEALARRVLSRHFGVPLAAGRVAGVPKLFDLVSPDGAVVGDAKYYTLVGGERLPPAKFSVIAEHVWLLEKTQAARRFLVFGNDARVPRLWLERYGHLAAGVTFFFLHDDGRLEVLQQ